MSRVIICSCVLTIELKILQLRLCRNMRKKLSISTSNELENDKMLLHIVTTSHLFISWNPFNDGEGYESTINRIYRLVCSYRMQWNLVSRARVGLRVPLSLLFSEQVFLNSIHLRNYDYWTSLVVQWLRIRLPMQGTRVRALVQEDPTCRGATKPVCHNYWAHVPQLLKPTRLEPVLCNKRSHRNEEPAHHNEE